MSIIAIAY